MSVARVFFTNLARCTKWESSIEKSEQKEPKDQKVIHIQKCGKMEKMELCTKLYTLSTEKKVEMRVFTVEKSNVCFVHKL